MNANRPLLDTFDVGALDIRLAPAITITDEHVKTFAVYGLWQALCDFGVGQFESDRIIRWYYKTAPTWSPKPSQSAFNRYARERVSDYVGYTRRRADARGVIDRLFDRARWDRVTFDECIDAVTLLCPTQPFSFGVVENRKVSIVDLTKRADSPRLLKVDASFLPLLKRLYPFMRTGDTVIKHIPVGNVIRDLNLLTLAFWILYPDASRDEREAGYDFHGADCLDWTSANLYSFWREGPRAAKYQDHFYGVPTEKVMPSGDVTLTDQPGSTVISTDDLRNATADPIFAKPTATANARNKARQDAYERGAKARKINFRDARFSKYPRSS